MERGHQDAKVVVERWAQLWSTGDLADTDRVFAPDLYDHRPPPAHDIEEINGEKQFITRMRFAFPDLRVEIEDIVVEGDRVAARIMHRGTHRGDFLRIHLPWRHLLSLLRLGLLALERAGTMMQSSASHGPAQRHWHIELVQARSAPPQFAHAKLPARDVNCMIKRLVVQ